MNIQRSIAWLFTAYPSLNLSAICHLPLRLDNLETNPVLKTGTNISSQETIPRPPYLLVLECLSSSTTTSIIKMSTPMSTPRKSSLFPTISSLHLPVPSSASAHLAFTFRNKVYFVQTLAFLRDLPVVCWLLRQGLLISCYYLLSHLRRYVAICLEVHSD